MTALESVVAWAESLPDWQSDAVRRLLGQDSLSDKDRSELLTMLKARHGLLPAGAPVPTIRPLQKGMVSGAPRSKVNVILKAMKDLRSVNRIPDGSELPFGHEGLTVIYGENGSGKSGYARVLKRACRARDVEERILPNVYSSEGAAPAKATFKVSVNGGTDQEIVWEDGSPSDEILTNITVFDAKCARVILDEKNEATYLPYGTHVFADLATLMKWMKAQIESQQPTPQRQEYTEIPPATQPGLFLLNIKNKTEKDIHDSFLWTDGDAENLEKLNKKLAEIEADDPAKRAAIVRSFGERVTSLKAYVEQRECGLSDERVNELKEALNSLAEAEKALKIVSESTLQGEPLPHVGESAWQMLYSAAKEYSTKGAYPGDDFPAVGEDSRCVFCMQLLSEEAKQRLLRLKAFMEQATKRKQEDAKRTVESLVRAIETLKDKAEAERYLNTMNELAQRDEALATVTRAYLATLDSRLAYTERLISGSEAGELASLPSSPFAPLTQAIDALEQEAAGFEKATDRAERDRLKEEKSELVARKCFDVNRERILAYLTDVETAAKCGYAIHETNYRTITLAGKSIVSKALTPRLREGIRSELEKLGVAHLPLSLKPSGGDGETVHQLELKDATPGHRASLTDVLSEGEQRAVALAGFLAEIGLSEHSCPIVLDDPVCSLDHRFRSRVAARLVEESKKRQVLVFTHDIAFQLDLQEEAARLAGHFTAQMVLSQGESAGLPSQGAPWHTMPVNERLGRLGSDLDDIEALYASNQIQYDRCAASLYGDLRETWEAAIEEVVLNKVIVRHRGEVQTLRLRKVGLTTKQYEAIHVNMSKCSKYMIGHDKSKALDVHLPAPGEIRADIGALRSFLTECKGLGKALEEERNRALEPEKTEIG